MRHLKLYSLLLLLSLSSASEASIVSYAVGQSTGQSNANYEAKQKAMAEGRISCVPQHDSSEQLWKCEDAFDHNYENLVIILKEDFDKLKANQTNQKKSK